MDPDLRRDDGWKMVWRQEKGCGSFVRRRRAQDDIMLVSRVGAPVFVTIPQACPISRHPAALDIRGVAGVRQTHEREERNGEEEAGEQ
jgi:hypothetical protein